MAKEFKKIETKVVHSGEPDPLVDGAVVTPIFQSSTFEFQGETSYHDIRYARLSNTPNHHLLHRKLAMLENAEAALVTSSGMAAISTALLATLKSGDHLLAQNSLYGGTYDLLTKDLGNYGISHDFVSAGDPESWAAKLKPNTKVFYVETITNPTMAVGNLKEVIGFSRAHGLVTMIDNTFASPINFRPAEHGFDISLHSCSKYLNGHTDLIAGAVIGRKELVVKITHLLNHLGGSLDTHACFLLNRGIKTLALRVRQQNESAMVLAEFLDNHPAVLKVNYPGLKSNPSYQNATKLLDGFGGMISFEPAGGIEAADRIMEKLEIPYIAASLGGTESLVSIPARVSHAGLTPDELKAAGISESLIRISVGIEATDEIVEDYQQALES